MADALLTTIRDAAITELRERSLPRVRRCLAELDAAALWRAPSRQLVSPGHLLLHLCGNIGQYILAGLGGEPDRRERSSEFTTDEQPAADELLARFTETIERACAVIAGLDAGALSADYRIQGMDYTGTAIVVHVVEHCSYHVGQIAFWTKLSADVDLGFYAGQDLDQRIE